MSERNAKSFDDLVEEVRNAVIEYENQREVCLSFRKHFSELPGIKVWSEPALALPDGSFKTPDLLLAQRDSLVLDYKEITSKAKPTLNAHLIEMSEYRRAYNLGQNRFEPDVAIICPIAAAPGFRDLVNLVPILGCRLGKTIKLKHIAGEFRSKELANIFLNEVTFPLANELTLQKFLRHPPRAVAYIAEIVRTVLWQLNQTLGSNEIRATKGQLVDVMSTLYPPYLLSHRGDDIDINQVTLGRVNQALEFLVKIDFITIKKAPREKEMEDVISTSRTKAPQVTDFIGYFIRKEAEQRFEALEKAKRKVEREMERKVLKAEKDAAKVAGQEGLEKWFERKTHSDGNQ